MPEQTFASSNIDPLLGSELMSLLGVETYDLDNPRKLSMFQDVVSYFQRDSNARIRILQLLVGKPGVNKLDFVWSWSRLQVEKQRAIQSLNPEDFSPDIQGEIVDGHLTKESIKRLKEDIAERRAQARRRASETRERRMQEEEHNVKGSQATEEAVELSKLNEIDITLDELDQITNEIEHYG